MEIAIAVFLFLLGLVLVVKGGDWFVDSASWMARVAHIPQFIIGATIVSIATTLPEMIVSITAAVQGNADMAVGNAVGSVIANTALIMALPMLFLPIIIERKKFMPQGILLIAATAVLWLGCLSGHLALWSSIVLVLILCVFMFFNVKIAKKEFSLPGNAADSTGENSEAETINKKIVIKNIVLFILGAAAIVFGSRLLVDKGSYLAEIIGIPQRVISVTLVAVGTSLPELVTAITAIRKKDPNISVGNIVGANVIDITLILPACDLFSKTSLSVTGNSLALDLPVCFAVSALAVIPLILMQKAHKVQGLLFLAIYAAFLTLTFTVMQ